MANLMAPANAGRPGKNDSGKNKGPTCTRVNEE
jgi:hypothetical protein